MDSPRFDFTPIFIFCGLAGASFIGGIWFIIKLSSSKEIKVSKRLEPIRTELVIVEGKVDTLFVYKKP